jgi:hypothetical protein
MFAGDYLFTAVIFAVVLLGVVSFTLFIRRLLINTSAARYNGDDISEKLDRIIELLEKRD